MANAPTPLPRIEAYERMMFGMQMHWGLYAILGRGEWVMHRESIPAEEYNKLKDQFTAEDFDAGAIARLARDAGMRYITLTTRHHDGFSLYDTRGLSDFDAPHSAAGRDLIAEFVEGCRAEDIVPFFYHTTLDWQWDSANCDERKFNEYLDYLHASVEVLCEHYGPVGGLAFDGNWSRWDADWKEDRLYGVIRKHQPDAIIINNPGMKKVGHVTHPELDVANFEQHGVRALDQEGADKYRAARMSQTINHHWGIGLQDVNYKSPGQIIETISKCKRVNAIYMLNVGPTAGGAVPELDAAILRAVGVWTHLNADALYGSKPVEVECPERDFVAENNGKWYYFVHDLGIRGHEDVTVKVAGKGPRTLTGATKPVKRVAWLDNDEELKFSQDGDSVTIDFTGFPYGADLVVRMAEIEL